MCAKEGARTGWLTAPDLNYNLNLCTLLHFYSQVLVKDPVSRALCPINGK